MRAFHALFLLVLTSFLYAQRQQAIPVLRYSTTTSTLMRSHATFHVEDFNGEPYAELKGVARAMSGQLRWRHAAHAVELSLKGNRVRFGWDSVYVYFNGQRARMEHPTIKKEDDFWVPLSFLSSSAFFSETNCRLDWKEPPKPKVQEPAPAPVTISAPAKPTISAAKDARAVRRIVIDPGHGGKDPGTVSPHGVEEKAINLLLAKELGDILREERGYEVLLTRTDDSFIPLAKRTKIANDANADLFISLHCNASLSSKLKGFEVYFQSETASDPRADAVARAENASLALESESGPPPQLQALLRSMVRNAYINESSALGSLVDRHVSQRLSEPSLGVKQAGFYVLRGAEMPSILVEAGFLTNPREERLLQNEKFRARLAKGVVAAVDAYDERKRKDRGHD